MTPFQRRNNELEILSISENDYCCSRNATVLFSDNYE
jgi:hypothetical protein